MPVAVTLFSNTQLAQVHTGGQTSTVAEPSLANNGRHILFTGNWYAARSADSGTSWVLVDPFSFFPPAGGGFCCDQTALYDQAHDLTIWLLQYIEQNNSNVLRIAVKSGPPDTPGGWRWWDLSPQAIDATWSGEWFDYNHAALSNNFLYVGTNAFKSVGPWTRCVVFRIPLANLASGTGFSMDKFVSTQYFSLRCTQGATDHMYFVAHHGTNNNTLVVHDWPEASATVTATLVPITSWLDGTMSAPFTGSPNWLERCDSRITGAWVSNGTIGAMWTANRQPPSRPLPFVRVARINAQTMAVHDEPDIWGSNSAYAYPDAYPNTQGVVGVTLFTGGGVRHPTHLVGVRDDGSASWQLRTAAVSTHSPNDSKWGDYLSCRRHSPDGVSWIASGFTLQGGGDRTNVAPQYVHFGLDQHQPSANRWYGV